MACEHFVLNFLNTHWLLVFAAHIDVTLLSFSENKAWDFDITIYWDISLGFSLSLSLLIDLYQWLFWRDRRSDSPVYLSPALVPDPSPPSHALLLALITAICKRARETGSSTWTCDLLPPLAGSNQRPCYQLLESVSVHDKVISSRVMMLWLMWIKFHHLESLKGALRS